MKHFTFRCVKITFEEKKSVRIVKGDEVHETDTCVAVQFEQAVEYTGQHYLHGYGHISLNLSDEQFKKLEYRVGQEYVLSPILPS